MKIRIVKPRHTPRLFHVLQGRHHTGDLTHESFRSSLFKGSRAPRAEPLVASAEATHTRRFWFFLRPRCQKERKQFSHIIFQQQFVFYIELILSVLFDGVAAKKNVFASQIKRCIRSFAPAGATRALPLTCDLFEKRSIKNFHPVEGDRLGGGRKLSSCGGGPFGWRAKTFILEPS